MIQALLQPRQSSSAPGAENGRHILLIGILGFAAYGFTMGCWRSPLMGGYVAVKLPLVVITTFAANGFLNGLLGTLLGGLSFRSSLLCLLRAFAAASLILGSLAPITLLLAINAPTPQNPNAHLAHAAFLAFHVSLIAIAGLVGTVTLFRSLLEAGLNLNTARFTLTSWIAGNAFLGAQFSWIFRPFFGTPTLEVAFLRPHPLEGSFYDAFWSALYLSVGPHRFSILITLALIAAIASRELLKPSPPQQRNNHES